MDILKGKIRPLYFKYLAAASGSAMVACVFGMIDAMMVGKYHGPVGTAALAVFNPLWGIIFGLGLLAGIGGSVLFANHRGRGEEKEAQQYFTLSILYGLVLSALAMLVIGLLQNPMFRLFGADDTLMPLAKAYLAPILFAIPCCVFSNILSAYLRNDDNPTLATTAVVIGGIFNAIGDYVCVFVWDMGIQGAGLATAAGQFITIFVMLTHFLRKRNTLRIVRPVRAWKKLCKISAMGFSTGINDLAMGVIGVLFNRQIMTHLGSDALAVYGVITQITAFAQCPAYGIGQASQPIISQNYGAKQYGRIRECQKYSLYTSGVMGAVFAAAVMLFPLAFVNFFMEPTPAVLEIAPQILRAYGLSFLLLPFNIYATYYFQAMMKPQISLVTSLARGVVISGGLLLLLPSLVGAASIWYAMLITEVMVALFSGIYMARYTPRCTK